MKALIVSRALSLLGAIIISAIQVAPYEVASAVHYAVAQVEGRSSDWLLAGRNGRPPFRI